MQLLAESRLAISDAFAATASRPQTRAEERANSLSHGLGLAAALAAGALLLATAAQRGHASFLVGALVYVATGVGLYLASTVYHALPAGRAKRAWLVVDHAAIFLFIAGSYTPFTLGVLRGPWGSALFFAVWGLALAGVAFKVIDGADSHPKLSTAVYLGLGWVLLLAAGPVWRLIAPAGLLWLLAGGVAFTVGVAFFRAERLPYAHFIWHLFVLAGTACHFIAVLRYASGT
jgi:hemolysin III